MKNIYGELGAMSIFITKIWYFPNSSYYCKKLMKLDKGQVKKNSCHTFSYEAERNNMRKYQHLTFEDRIYIEVWQWERKSLSFIASRLGVHPATIARELARGNTAKTAYLKGYRADLGERWKRVEGRKKGRKRKIQGDLAILVEKLIRQDWSPEQISDVLKRKYNKSVSHETIYSYLKDNKKQGGGLYLHLRHGKRRRKKRFSIPRVRADILNRKHISERPNEINSRQRYGDWERDLMFGDSRKSALLVFVERKTLLTRIRKVESKSPREIAEKTIEVLGQEKCLSLTNDNGFEFRNHHEESKALEIPIYFTNPYSSWEKGTCENTNGLIRQYFPHG
jgi:IS30 family transposase